MTASSWNKSTIMSLPMADDAATVSTVFDEQDQLPTLEEVRSSNTMGGSARFDEGRRKRRNRRMWFGVIGMVVLLAVIIGLAVGLSKNKSKNKNDQDDTDRTEEVVTYLSSYSDPEALATSGTPQYRAARWMATEDPARHDVPSKDEENPHFLQRYVLALFYYATTGDDWKDRWNFLSSADECWWNVEVSNDKSVLPFGAACDRETHDVITLVLGE